ncbi:hypothetical protein [Brevundimonas sp. PAMC22021]|uniref:hypothetical protein n=1 Tax=Brevundimonas sp. PAMC22021 TaxID=2861285 RepID=UPI001C63A72D|nr:hypothetical protein [Brevundimonas sp. PAMC22021]QYF86428.1 hypothetical protein KY493_11415 [Brevundimonas sp. PAMC22021]
MTPEILVRYKRAAVDAAMPHFGMNCGRKAFNRWLRPHPFSLGKLIQMTKTTLLTAASAVAVLFAGAAQAHDVQYRAIGPAGSITSADTNAAAGPGNAVVADQDANKYGRSLVGLYLIAQESLGASLGAGTLALQDPLTAGTLPSGNNLYTISLTNATFGRAISNADLTGANCTSVISSGGTATSSSVTFLVSSAGGGTCAGFTEVNLPVLPTAAGTVTVTTNYTTEAGLPIDGGADSLDAIYAIDAFQPTVNATFSTANTGPGAGADTFAQLAPATGSTTPYTALSGDDDLGRLAIYVDTRANRTLIPADPNAAVADVTNATVTVTGDFSAFDGAAGAAGNPTLTSGVGGGVLQAALSGNVATFANAQGNITQLLSAKPAGSVFEVVADGGVIPVSDYNAGIAFTLATGYATQPNGGGAFETIEREGTNFIAPWFSGSGAQSQSQIRMSSTGQASGAVRVTVTNGVFNFNGTPTTFPTTTCAQTFQVPADGDLVISTATMQSCFGTFTRGDVLITVEGASAGLTAKMRNTSPQGNFETTLGRYSGSNYATMGQ